jgi:hypothetical protein
MTCGIRSMSDAVSPPVMTPRSRAASIIDATWSSRRSSRTTSRDGSDVCSTPSDSSTRPRVSLRCSTPLIRDSIDASACGALI